MDPKPLSLKKLVDLDGHKAVLCRSRMNPSLGWIGSWDDLSRF